MPKLIGKSVAKLVVILSFFLVDCSRSTAVQIVSDGDPRAEIVIAQQPSRTQRLAARELQTYVHKISGAVLPIVSELGDQPVKIYIGQSQHTEKLGVTAEGLRHGAYQIVSAENHLVLIGDDTDFVPIEPWPRNNSDNASGKMQAAWNKITGKQWGFMNRQLHKHYSGPNTRFGTATEEIADADGNIHVWSFDERGSFNAVCDLLRSLGVRWYMPGDVGEIVPKLQTIEIPRINKTVRPDFPMRILNFRPSVEGREVMMWAFRLGVRRPYGRQAAHGLHRMTDNPWTLENRPEWFALYGGQRHNQTNIKCNQLCYSNEELLREAVAFAKAQFDHMAMDVVSIMPPDGYTAICQCEKCQGKESPELGPRGKLSNYVWDFVNRVAAETAKSHPNKKISCCAYGVYTQPPSNIQKLNPNVQVIIVGGRRPTSEDREDLRRLRRQWQAKTDSPLEIFENYPFTARGFYLPAFMPKVLCNSINETKQQSRGEDIWFSMDFGPDAIGFNHFIAYFTARMYWGGPNQDGAAMFDEYVKLFYGPAALETKAFLEFCEGNWRDMEKDAEKAAEALDLFEQAKSKVPSSSVYRQRLAFIDNFLNGLRNKARQLAQRRGPVPKLRLVSGVEQRGTITIDGLLDDGPWAKIPSASVGRLLELQTGRLPTFGTRLMAEWVGSDFYLAIRCDELPGSKPNSTATKDGDQAIWYGDAIEVLLETDAHSYYQIAVNPAGAVVDLDRGAPKQRRLSWSSQAEVATRVADDHWTVEMRIPVTSDANDPLHQVIGHKPTQSLPWHINVCRQRIRDGVIEHSAFSPTGTKSFHVPIKFAHFHSGRSFSFDSDNSATDFVIANQAAERLLRQRKYDSALQSFVSLSQRKGVTEFQKSVALARAVESVIATDDFQRAGELSLQIPNPFIAKTAKMRTLASQRQWKEVIDEFEDEDFAKWPFWQIGEAAAIRGKAFFQGKFAEQADKDLRLAVQHEPDAKKKASLRTILAQNCESHLNEPDAALVLYLDNISGKNRIGSADEIRSFLRATAILRQQERTAEALKMFEIFDLQRLSGHWKYEVLLAKAKTLAAVGQTDESAKIFQQIQVNQAASKAQHEAAAAGIAK